MPDDLIRLHTGVPIGRAFQADNGDIIGAGFDGRIIGGYTSDGETLDVDDLVEVHGEYVFRVTPEEQREAEYDRDLAFAEAREYHDEHEDAATVEADADESDDEAFKQSKAAMDLGQQMDDEARRQGHDFTRAQMTELAERARTEINAGRRPDIRKMIEDDPTLVSNLDDHQQRLDWMSERAADAEREAREQELNEPDPGIEDADLDDGEQRREYLSDRMQGRSASSTDQVNA